MPIRPRGVTLGDDMTRHLPHLLMLVVPLLAFFALFVREWRRTAGSVLPTTLRLMAAGSVGAALVHAAVVPEHVREGALLGWFFTLLCLAQLVWSGVLLLVPRSAVVRVGALGNLGVVALWAWTRGVGVPFVGGRETVGVAGVVATACELLVVAAGAVALQGDGRLALTGARTLVEVREVHDEEQPATAEHQRA